MNISEEIKRLHELHQSGALTDAEFSLAKEKLLSSLGDSNHAGPASQEHGQMENPFAHLNQLRRSKTDQWLGGVCGGLGKFSSLDAWVWRMIFVLFVTCFGFGIVAYLLAWVFIPEEE